MNILFVCTGNTCRSPMAEGITRALAAEQHQGCDHCIRLGYLPLMAQNQLNKPWIADPFHCRYF